VAETSTSPLWRYARLLAAPTLLLILVIAALKSPMPWWLGIHEKYDEEAVREWIKEARVSGATLRSLSADYLRRARAYHEGDTPPGAPAPPGFQKADQQILLQRMANSREDIAEHLQALGTPPTKMYANQLILFPVVYRLEVNFNAPDLPAELREPVVWDSDLPRRPGQYRVLEPERLGDQATVTVHYQLHTYHKQQQDEQADAVRQQWITILAVIGTVPALLWMYFVQRRERERERQRALAQHQIDQAERLLLEEELRRQEAERRREDAERDLLQQQLATRSAEQHALELKSQIYASIGIMAGSYAHNIKNLLVRPNDLLTRCLEGDGLSSAQEEMLGEVRETLGTVTERLQQILRTVRRDPTKAELSRLDLNAVLGELVRTWRDLAREKWKLTLELEAWPEPLWVQADLSHLQQAVENLIFNARDATFEMRNHQRNLARSVGGGEADGRKQALIAAAAWRGRVVLRTRQEGGRAVMEVSDNGIGMTEEVRRRCTEPHFSTKRDNALYEGHSTGMGLGLSFVTVIVEHHGGTLAIESEPQGGTTFRVTLPLAG
jgi:signal transduction histidine kinase